MNPKENIIQNLRNQLRVKKTLTERRQNVEDRVAEKARGVLPSFSNTKLAKIARFIKHAEAANSTVIRVDKSSIAKEIPQFLRRHNLPMRIRCGNDKQLDAIIEKSQKLVEFSRGPSDGNDLVGLSYALSGICETGTLAMISGDDNPTTINFLPENHIVIVNESDLVRHYEDVWDKLRKKSKGSDLPRTINLITGPSRSGDIEQKLILGAHGPTRLHILLLNK